MMANTLRRGAALLLAVVPLAGCDGPQDEGGGFRVALVVPGPVSDDGWNASAAEGLERIARETGAATRLVQVRAPAAFEGTFRDFATRGYDLVIGHGFEFSEAAGAVAAEHPGTAFVVTSGAIAGENVTSIQFAIEEPARQAGYLAAALSASGRIGVVGGVEIPPVKDAFEAFRAGALARRGDADVRVVFLGSWEDVSAAHQAARALADQGCDVLFHDADAAGLGVLNAAEERGLFAIGCNRDQAGVKPDTVVASVVLDVPEAFARLAREVRDGTHRGSVRRFDAASGVVRLAFNPRLVPALQDGLVDEVAAFAAAGAAAGAGG